MVVMSSPSCPLTLMPQASTCPVLVRASVWVAPALIARITVPGDALRVPDAEFPAPKTGALVPGRRLPGSNGGRQIEHVRACLVQMKLACAACWPLPETGLIGTGRVAVTPPPGRVAETAATIGLSPGQTPMPDGLGFISPGEMPRGLKAPSDQSPARNERDSRRPPVPA